MRVGLVQLRTPAQPEAALAHAAPWVREAAAQGATFVLTPEATNVIQRDRAALLPLLRPVEDDAVVTGLRALAAELKITLLIGSALVRDGETFANRSLLIDETGTITAAYDKIHMFDVDLPNGESPRESAVYTPGARAVVADVAGARLGLTVCYDLRFPHLPRVLAKAGAQMIAVPSAFTRPTGEAHWEVLLRARAIETGAYVLAPAQGGLHEDGRGTWGRSLVVDPWGAVVGRLDHDEPGVLIADLDFGRVTAARRAIPALANDRAFSPPAA
jgi:predicted amidohydrolase